MQKNQTLKKYHCFLFPVFHLTLSLSTVTFVVADQALRNCLTENSDGIPERFFLKRQF